MPPQGHGFRPSRLEKVGLVGVAWAAVILLRLIQVQVVRHDPYAEAAAKQHREKRLLPAPRGTIVDRAGRTLSLSVRRESVYVDPRHSPPAKEAAAILSEALGLDYAALREKLEQAQAERRGFLYVKRRISPQEAERLRRLRQGWIRFETELVRDYPKGALAPHTVGVVDFEQKGVCGIESSLEAELAGRPGLAEIVKDVWGRVIQFRQIEEPQPGATIALTIDERIQFAAERALEEAARSEGCSSGSVVVMEPNTGELLAMASFPTFDPNQPPNNEEEEKLRFLNCPVSVPFEPGSVFKIVTVAAALETTPLRPDTVVPCGSGRLQLYGRLIHDHHPYAALPVADVLAKSSNIGAIQIGLRVGEAKLYEYVCRFGFGQRTGVPLPAESRGQVRDPARWQKTSLASIAMGHEVIATPLQLARAVAVIASGGLLVKPKLLLWREPPGGPRQHYSSDPPQRVLRPETAFLMRRLMEGVVLRGTGAAARLDGYSSAGKTGTAQIYDPVAKKYLHLYNASFAGFAPVTNPAIVVAVTLNGARHYGGVVAAPVFRRVATEALRVLNVPRDLPESAWPADPEPADFNDLAVAELATPPVGEGSELGSDVLPRADGLAARKPDPVLVVPDFHGRTMPAVLAQALALGLTIEPIGSGVARQQAPGPGELLPSNGRVRVVFGP